MDVATRKTIARNNTIMIRRTTPEGMTAQEYERDLLEPDRDCDLDPPIYCRATTLQRVADAVIDGALTWDQGGLMAAAICGTSKTEEFTKACENLFKYPKEDDRRCDEALAITCKYATQAKIEQLQLLKSEVREGYPLRSAVWLASQVCGVEPTPHFDARVADFLSGAKRYGTPAAEDICRLFSPKVNKGISI